MRVLRCFVAAALLIGLAVPALAEGHEDALMKELTELGDKLAEAMVDGDWEMTLGMYADDAISLPNFGPRMQGIDEFRAQNEMMMQAGMKILSFESDPTEAWEAGDQIVEIGTYKISLEYPGAPGTVHDHGKYLTIYERDEDGNLKIKVETWNTDMNPMQMMAGMGGGESHGHEHGDEAEDVDDAADDADEDDGDDGDDA